VVLRCPGGLLLAVAWPAASSTVLLRCPGGSMAAMEGPVTS
jgi:hypothetical protein